MSFLPAREGGRLNRVAAPSGGLSSQSFSEMSTGCEKYERCCKHGREHVNVMDSVSAHACENM